MKMKKIKIGLIVLTISMLAASISVAADAYKADPVHSTIGFSVRHMMVIDVKGEFTEFDVAMTFDKKDLSAVSIDTRIDATSIDTRHEKRDSHLKSPDFLDVQNHPALIFKSSRVEKTGDGTYTAHGTLTIRGVSKPVKLPFTLRGPITDPWGNVRIGISSNYTLKRMDYGVAWNQKMKDGGLIVGTDVNVDMNLEMVRQ